MPRPSASPALRVLRTLRTGSRMTLRRHKDFLALAALCRKSPATADYSPSGHSALPWLAAWGLIHGLILIFEKSLGSSYLAINNFLRWIITTILVVGAWTFFRLEYSDAILMLGKMFGFCQSLSLNFQSPYYEAVLFMMLPYLLIEHTLRFYQIDTQGFPILHKSNFSIITLAALVILALNFSGSPLPFIYFEF